MRAMLARIAALVAPENAAALAAAAQRARALPQPTPAAMAERTLALYDDGARRRAAGRRAQPA